jgi:indole-3-glycerol phosphate synthase
VLVHRRQRVIVELRRDLLEARRVAVGVGVRREETQDLALALGERHGGLLVRVGVAGAGGRPPKMCRIHVNRTSSEVQATTSFDVRTSAPAAWTPPDRHVRERSSTRPAVAPRRRELPPSAACARRRTGRATAVCGRALRGETLRVIAEVKRASPSKGAIAPGLDAAAQARAYAAGGAAAISVLTEPTRFGGALEDLGAATAAVGIPVLRKDFIVAPVQIWEARVHGAAAVLLIARALSPNDLAALHDEARNAGLEVLVEIRDASELARALSIGAAVIGVNNRNLETLAIDPRTAPAIIPHIPAAVIAIAESGMAHTDDARPAQAAGADALLIGSAISAAPDPRAAVATFTGLPRVTRS